MVDSVQSNVCIGQGGNFRLSSDYFYARTCLIQTMMVHFDGPSEVKLGQTFYCEVLTQFERRSSYRMLLEMDTSALESSLQFTTLKSHQTMLLWVSSRCLGDLNNSTATSFVCISRLVITNHNWPFQNGKLHGSRTCSCLDEIQLLQTPKDINFTELEMQFWKAWKRNFWNSGL